MTRRAYIHPFPARMAPELALAALQDSTEGAMVLDPMVGSGTVIKQASDMGMRSRGYDLDPLAVLITRASVTPVDLDEVERLAKHLLNVSANKKQAPKLSWVDGCAETSEFTKYWFGLKQRRALRKIAHWLYSSTYNETHEHEMNVLRVALSRIIVTKNTGASLAHDVSHSRPHRVMNTNDYDVFEGFAASVARTVTYLENNPPKGNATILNGDARRMPWTRSESMDLVVTSPPYLNAIDYLRGHRMSLVWLGHRMPELRNVRSTSIGAERAADKNATKAASSVIESFGVIQGLPQKYQAMIERYAQDLSALLASVHRVLKANGKAIIVIGDSHLKGVSVSNSEAIAAAGRFHGFEVIGRRTRELPKQSRYLPISISAENALNKRMKEECILTLRKIA